MYPGWPELYEKWHDFFLLSGTAAVTLVALLFVAIALHIEALIHPAREHMLALARSILMSFIVVMVMSLMMLVPEQRMRAVAMELVVLGMVGLVITVRQTRFVNASHHHEHFTIGLFRRRMVLPLIGYGGFIGTGVLLLVTRVPEAFFLCIGFVCMLLGNGAGSSWDLLVRVAKVKRADEERAERAEQAG